MLAHTTIVRILLTVFNQNAKKLKKPTKKLIYRRKIPVYQDDKLKTNKIKFIDLGCGKYITLEISVDK